jgi:rRNA maturation protein Rpf1
MNHSRYSRQHGQCQIHTTFSSSEGNKQCVLTLCFNAAAFIIHGRISKKMMLNKEHEDDVISIHTSRLAS